MGNPTGAIVSDHEISTQGSLAPGASGTVDIEKHDMNEKQHDGLHGVQTSSTVSPSSTSTLRKTSIASVQRILSSILDEPVGPYRSSEPRPWRAKFMRFAPVVGLLSMMTALLSILAAFGILAESRGDAVDSWITAPPTYLAICTAIANLAMRYACVQGVIITWWMRAIRGSTVKRLHEDWRAGTSIRGAITSSSFGLLSPACLVSTIVVIDGPLLQKASTVQSAPITDQTVHLNISATQELLRDYTGAWTTAAQAGLGPGSYWADAFNRSSIPAAINRSDPNNIVAQRDRPYLNKEWARRWIWGGTITPDFVSGGCPGTCKTKIRAPALAKTPCRSFQHPVNYTQVHSWSAYSSEPFAPPLSLAAFIIDISLQLHGNESIDFVTGYAHSYQGIGTINITTCNLVSAVGEYEIIISNDPPSVDSACMPDIIAYANNTQVTHERWARGSYYSTLGGVVNEAYEKWASWESFWTQPNGAPASLSMRSYTTDFFAVQPLEVFHDWTDPHDQVMKDLNKLMFITGVFAAVYEDHSVLGPYLDSGLPLETTVTAKVLGNHNVFETNFHWFIAAAVVELVCVSLVLPTYWGWWHLGRPMSFSPLEIAKAFESPILDQCNSNSSGRDIAKVLGEIRLQYGATKSADKNTALAFASPELVDRPVKDARFDV